MQRRLYSRVRPVEAVRLGFSFGWPCWVWRQKMKMDDSVTYCDTKLNMMIKRKYSTIIVVKIRWRVFSRTGLI